METDSGLFSTKMDELVRAIKEVGSDVCEVIRANQSQFLKNVTPMPDIVDYGDWEVCGVGGMWGTSANWKKIGFLGYVNNYDPIAMCRTSIYHEFTKWLLRNPRNRNFWYTGNNVEFYRGGKLYKTTETQFRMKHRETLKHFFEGFVDRFSEQLLEEANRVLGEVGPDKFSQLVKYVEEQEFTNAKSDSIYSNQVCKETIKQVRYHLKEKIDTD